MIDKIYNNEQFSFTKINYGYWEYILKKQKKDTNLQYYKETLREIYKCIHNLDKLKDFYFGIDHGGLDLITSNFDRSRVYNISENKENIENTCRVIKKHLPKDYIPINGQIFRNAALDGSLPNFFSKLGNYTVITIGHKRLASFGSIFKFKSHHHITIHPTNSWQFKDTILKRIKYLISLTKSPQILLFQGSYVGTWWIFQLHGIGTLIDIGRSIDVFYPDSKQQTWIYLFNLEDKYKEYY